MTSQTLVRQVEEFPAGSRGAFVMDDGAVTFDLSAAKYSLSGEYDKCLLHLWSSERNTVRRVLDAEVRNDGAARERFAQPVAYVRQVMPQVEIVILSPTEVAFRCHGLEFARARLGHEAESFRSRPEVVFGLGAAERLLGEGSTAA